MADIRPISDFFNPTQAVIDAQQTNDARMNQRIKQMQLAELAKKAQDMGIFTSALQSNPVSNALGYGQQGATGPVAPQGGPMAQTAQPAGMPGQMPNGQQTPPPPDPEQVKLAQGFGTYKQMAQETMKAIKSGNGDRVNQISKSFQQDPLAQAAAVKSSPIPLLSAPVSSYDPNTEQYSIKYQVDLADPRASDGIDKLAQIPGGESLKKLPPGKYTLDFDPQANEGRGALRPPVKLDEGITEAKMKDYPAEFREAYDELKQKTGKAPTLEEASALSQQRKITATAAQGAARYQTLKDLQEYQVIDSQDNNRPKFVTGKILKQDSEGRYTPIAGTEKALTRTALIEDIRGAMDNTRKAVVGMKSDFTGQVRAQLALALRDRDPRSAMSTFMGSTWMNSLSPDQQDYVVALNQLIENAMAMRSVLGAGQGSEDLRMAIQRTIPSFLTPNKQYAMKQIDAFEAQINRLSRGIPKVKLRDTEDVSGKSAPSGDDPLEFR